MVLRLITLSGLYFLAAFAAGFILGAVRVLWIVELLGERSAELIEMPIMAIVCGLLARVLVLRYGRLLTVFKALCVGLIALALLLSVEFSVVLQLRQLSIEEYFASRDPVAGLAYLIGLIWFALAPCFFYFCKADARP